MGILDSLGLNFGRGVGGGAMGGGGVGGPDDIGGLSISNLQTPQSGRAMTPYRADAFMGMQRPRSISQPASAVDDLAMETPRQRKSLLDMMGIDMDDPQTRASMTMLMNSLGGREPMQGVNEAYDTALRGQAYKRKSALEEQERQETRTQKNRTREWIEKNAAEYLPYLDAGFSANDVLTMYHKDKKDGSKPPQLKFTTLQDGRYGFANETDGTFTVLGTAGKPVEKYRMLSDQEVAQRGLPPGDYQVGANDKVETIAGKTSNPNAGIPSGYRALDPNNPNGGLEPIPGGPAEVIPAEQASRIGMAEVFLGRVPELRKKLQNGDVSGVYDQTMAQKGFGSQGQIYQELKSGTDALQRFMTGAGMPQSEAEEYAGRYLPTYKDTPATAVSKLDRLTEELEAARRMVMRGKRSEAEINRSVTPDVSTMSDADLEAIANGQ